MSDWDDDLETIEGPSLDTEEGRDEWIDFVLKQGDDDEWAAAIVVQEGENMIARFRWPDGREEVFDLKVRRCMTAVIPAEPGESN